MASQMFINKFAIARKGKHESGQHLALGHMTGMAGGKGFRTSAEKILFYFLSCQFLKLHCLRSLLYFFFFKRKVNDYSEGTMTQSSSSSLSW